MTANKPSIDITRLEKVRRTGAKITARCPACQATGNDRQGNHFFLNAADGKFGCGAFPGDTEHRREIFALVGIKADGRRDPERDRQWKLERERDRRRESARRSLVESAKVNRDRIIARHPWEACDVWEDSPQRIDCGLVESDPRHFLDSLFPEDATVWTGEVIHSGIRHADHWKTIREWQNEPKIGPMVSPAMWKPGTVSRTGANVTSCPYVVLDFDGFDGIAPKTPGEIKAHVAASLALIRWIREGLHWELAAMIWTGSKSIHAWFHNPPPNVLRSLKDAAEALGIDAGLIGSPEHPCRLPGQRHQKTGRSSKVIWLQNPLS